MADVRALTLTQPWASLVAVGAKRIETRSWGTRYRGPLLIHAAAGLGSVGGKRGLERLRSTEPYRSALTHPYAAVLPLGAIVARCTLLGCAYMSPEWMESAHLDPEERAFGHYEIGRYAWHLAEVRALPEPVPCRGALGLWRVPEDAEALGL